MRCRRQFSSDFDGGNISGVLIVDGGSEHIDGRVVDIIGMRATKGINVKLIPVLGLILARAGEDASTAVDGDPLVYNEGVELAVCGTTVQLNIEVKIKRDLDKTVVGAAIVEVVAPEVMKTASEIIPHLIRCAADRETQFTTGLRELIRPQGSSPFGGLIGGGPLDLIAVPV